MVAGSRIFRYFSCKCLFKWSEKKHHSDKKKLSYKVPEKKNKEIVSVKFK